MKRQNTDVKAQSFGAIFFISLLLVTCYSSLVTAIEEKWAGVDETVVEKYAKEHGREAKKPFLNTDQGDLLLFAFLLAGTAGGFAAGYSWRKLTEGKKDNRESDEKPGE